MYVCIDELRNYGEEWQHPQNDKAVLFTLPHSLPFLA
jgi:hypothetical protein